VASEDSPQGRHRSTYLFLFEDGASIRFAIDLDPETFEMPEPHPEEWPEWTGLAFRKCPNCPLDEASSPRCPAAARLSAVVEAFRNAHSWAPVQVVVETPERTYSRHTDLQQGLSSMIGLVMATSGCPILARLRPMAFTHLPFMSPEESTFRTLSMYLLAQHVRQRAGLVPDRNLEHLLSLLEQCRETNIAFVRRLQSLGVKDATLNALARLNALGEITSLSVESDLSRLESLFRPYLST
jgi:hypothetical protein